MMLPTSVTGAMKPASGIETNSTGIPARAQSTTFWLVTSLHAIGAVGQHEKTVRGFSRSAASLPRTMSCRSRMTANPSIVKAPVTTGFSPWSRLTGTGDRSPRCGSARRPG
jgi:hypothetical protein